MKANFKTVNQRQLELNIPFEDFLCSGVMRRQALMSMCDPEQVICDYLDDGIDYDNPMEVRESFAEACALATDHELTNVSLDRNDIRFIRNQFGPHSFPPAPAMQVLRFAA